MYTSMQWSLLLFSVHADTSSSTKLNNWRDNSEQFYKKLDTFESYRRNAKQVCVIQVNFLTSDKVLRVTTTFMSKAEEYQFIKKY